MKVKKLFKLMGLSAALLGLSVGSAWAAGNPGGRDVDIVVTNASGEPAKIHIARECMESVGGIGDGEHEIAHDKTVKAEFRSTCPLSSESGTLRVTLVKGKDKSVVDLTCGSVHTSDTYCRPVNLPKDDKSFSFKGSERWGGENYFLKVIIN